MNTPTPYPGEILVVPRRKHRHSWLLTLVVTAAVLLALAYHPAARHSTAAVVTHQPAAHPGPARAAVTVTVGRAAYACTPVLKASPKARR